MSGRLAFACCLCFTAFLTAFFAACLVAGRCAFAGTPDASRGEKSLYEVVLDPAWPAEAYENAWKVWGLAEKPADYEAAFRRRYGLHPAPYENDGLPMGLKYIQ